jgi:UDP-2-acetamido-3-amino-2,3-dideoxy-glucuronate N-acetyltransferase
MDTGSDIKIAVVGAGYWGKNHVRNFAELGALRCVCDGDPQALKRAADNYENIDCVRSYDEVLSNDEIRGVVIATPASTHFDLARKAIEAGKDVLVEKPLALDTGEAEKLVEEADRRGAILMVGHILLYHPAVIKLKEIVDSGRLGKIHYIQSNRLSMGKIRNEENILWSFAPHDVSMILYLLEDVPQSIRAFGSSHLQKGIEDVTVSILDFPDGTGAHIYVSWMNPFKEHRLVVIGDAGMAVFEDSRPENKLRICHNSFEWVHRRPVPRKGEEEPVEVDSGEPLKMECMHFLECIAGRVTPRSDGREGLNTLRVLQECYRSMKGAQEIDENSFGAPRKEEESYFAHETAVIDDPASIGKGTRIWHFSHIMEGAALGENCRLGQNVLVGRGVKIGENCKIQNNVSIYEGVTLEDHVFCGPSMVFTNVFNPRCEIPRMNEIRPTLVKRGATIGANATIICGNSIGEYAFIGAGAVVTDSVPDHALMLGNPARRAGWMCLCGNRLDGSDEFGADLTCSACGGHYRRLEGERIEEHDGRATVRSVPLLDLKAQYRSMEREIRAAIDRVLESQRFILGPEVEAFEKETAEYVGADHAVGVSSGTDALLVAMMALGVGPGDEVITTPFTFFATVGSILRLGAEPVFADIDPETFNIDVEMVKRLVGPKTKVIMPVHLFGQCVDMDPLLEIAGDHGPAIVEDAAQAIGSGYKGRLAGGIGTAGCFSFFPSKNLGGFGDGGMVTTNDADLAERMRIIRNQGAKPKYHHRVIGGNFRLDALQAAVLRVKLRSLEDRHEARRRNADFYTRGLEDLGLAQEKVKPPRVLFQRHIFNQYVIKTDLRDELRSFLAEKGVGSEIYYPKPLHLQECLSKKGYSEGDLPVSEEMCRKVLALPVYPELSQESKEYVLARIAEFHGLRKD